MAMLRTQSGSVLMVAAFVLFFIIIAVLASLGMGKQNRIKAEKHARFMEACVADRGPNKGYECEYLWTMMNKKEKSDMINGYESTIIRLRDERDALEAENERLREALVPFADKFEDLFENPDLELTGFVEVETFFDTADLKAAYDAVGPADVRTVTRT